MMKTVKKTGKILLITLWSIIIAWMAFIVTGKLLNPTKYPMLFGYSEANIMSGSMEPTLSQGDHIIFRREESYELYDVIVYYEEAEGVFVAHRIVGKSGEDFIVQGDYNPECDTLPVREENIQGKVIFAVKNLQPFLYVAFGSIATILIQMLIKGLKLRKRKDPEKGGERTDEK